MWVQVEDQSPVEDSRLQSEIVDAVQIRSKKSYNHDSIVTPLIAKKHKNAMSTEMQRNKIYFKTIDVWKESLEQ